MHDILSEYGVKLEVGQAGGRCAIAFTLPSGSATESVAGRKYGARSTDIDETDPERLPRALPNAT